MSSSNPFLTLIVTAQQQPQLQQQNNQNCSWVEPSIHWEQQPPQTQNYIIEEK